MQIMEKSISPMPLYFRVLNELREKILSGEWPGGSRIPGEVLLAETFGVSVITVRQAMTRLMHDGYIERHRAKGSFVSAEVPLRKKISLNVEVDDLINIGPDTRFRLCAIDESVVPRSLREKLRVQNDEQTKRIARVRVENHQPLGYLVTYLASGIGHGIPDTPFRSLALPIILSEYSAIEITEVRHTIGAILASADVAALIDIPEGTSVLMIERDYLARNRIVAVSYGYYRSDLFRYELRLTHRLDRASRKGPAGENRGRRKAPRSSKTRP